MTSTEDARCCRLLNESHIPHGKLWKNQNLAGWILSEKLDGCRAIWDGTRMWTRTGNEIALPAKFRASLPDCVLDGEIWAGRGRFSESASATKYGNFTRRIRFMVFDAPGGGIYTARLAAARAALAGCAFSECVSLTTAESTLAAFEMMKRIQKLKGEGVIARAPQSRWFTGRSEQILKLKDHDEAQLATLL